MGGAVSAASGALGGGAVDVLSGGLTGGFGTLAGGLTGGGGGGFLGSLGQGIGSGLSSINPFHDINATPAPTLSGPSQVSTVTAPTVGNVAAPTAQQATGVGANSSNDFRAAQLNLINGQNGLANVANGKDNTAQRMLQQQTQQNVANQFAMANSARPGQQAVAMRNAMNNAAQMNANANVQGAQLGLQQRLQAAGLMGQVAGQGSGQDISVANNNASLGTQASIAGGAQATQRAVTQGQLEGQTNGQNIQAQGANQSAGLKYNDQLQGQWADVNHMNTGLAQSNRKAKTDMISGIAQSIPVIGSMFGGGGGGGGGVPGGADSLMGSSAGDQAAMAGPLGDAGTMMASHGGIVPTPNGIHIPYSLLLKRMVG